MVTAILITPVNGRVLTVKGAARGESKVCQNTSAPALVLQSEATVASEIGSN